MFKYLKYIFFKYIYIYIIINIIEKTKMLKFLNFSGNL